ncbi:MAG: AraC family transcriptional regulator [Luteimonas sp.]|nr:AraC family transcriptional regulator [Luteimonas sp.]
MRYHALHFAGSLELPSGAGHGLHVIHASGRGMHLEVPNGWLSLCLPLAGRLQLESADGYWDLAAGRVQVWRDGTLRLNCHATGLWLVLTGPLTAWQRHLHLLGHASDPEIFPRANECQRDLRRLLVRLARCARGTAGPGFDPATLVEAVCAALVEQQHDLHARVQRCSGRTLQRRRQTMLRLLRVRHLIESQGDERPDLMRLARSASYSPWHLIRMHRDVFGETPAEYAARLRLDRAWSLVRDTQAPVCEISEALGFESQSAFCRAFKKSFGRTTTEVRQAQANADSLAA